MPSSPICHPPSILKNRALGLFIWQSIAATAIYLVFSSLLLVLRLASLSFSDFLFSFFSFQVCLLAFSSSLLLLYSPCPHPSASPPELISTLLKSALKSCIGGYSEPFLDGDSWSRAARSLRSAFFLVSSIIVGYFSMITACWGAEESLVGLGIGGALVGLVFSVDYLYRTRWVLKFPVIQRPLFYSVKRGFISSFPRAWKLSYPAYFCSLIHFVLLKRYKINGETAWICILSQIITFIGIFFISYCWEISHHLLQVVHTRRCIFAPPQGSETNPSEILLEALEQSPSKSLVRHLAHLDLCMISENNSDSWRRAAFFEEETGESYRRAINTCLRPIEKFVAKLNDGLEGSGAYSETDLFSRQLMTQPLQESVFVKLSEAFDEFQVCVWAARSLAALTARSRNEDRFGVAQLSSSNIAGLTTLLSTLLAVESCLGKKTGNPNPASSAPSGFMISTVASGKKKEKEKTVTLITGKRREELNGKAYAMGDVLRSCIYLIVSAFRADMAENANVLERNWIGEGKPLFGSRGALVQKLLQFIEYRAV